MIVLGINFKHADASACIIKNGDIIAAVEEERFVRKKHYNKFPFNSIKFCLESLNIKINEVDYISLNNSPNTNFFNKVIYSVKQIKNASVILKTYKNKNKKFNLEKDIEKYFKIKISKNKIKYIDHHVSHIASSFYCSNFKKSVVLSIDGSGDFSTTAWGLAKNNSIKIDNRIYYPNSLGIFYEGFTQFLGFEYYGDEYKVMGLAAYGKPIYYEKLKNIFFNNINYNYNIDQKYFLIEKNYYKYFWSKDKLKTKPLLNIELVERLLGIKKRNKNDKLLIAHINLASSIQKIYEEILFRIINHLSDTYQCKNLCLSGGCAMNSVANGKIIENSNFKNLFIQPASGDAGGALGAALEVYYSQNKKRKLLKSFNPYLGPKYSNSQIDDLLKKNKKITLKFNISFLNDKELSRKIAKRISEGAVVGYFQGRMEWGARSLGNRSILCDPRNPKAKELLNIKIKKRENFRPFAPSILFDQTHKWFERKEKVEHMMQVYKIKNNKKKYIPAVTHIDGTGRLQTVEKNFNPKFFQLIKDFNLITNVPMLLNTSFNENEPVVCNPKEALDTFVRTKMDILVLENWVLAR